VQLFPLKEAPERIPIFPKQVLICARPSQAHRTVKMPCWCVVVAVCSAVGDVLVIWAKMERQAGAKRRHLATEVDIKAGKQTKLDLGRLFPKAIATTPPVPGDS
jgi:hypothetical protein